jgi:hypothetical protein
MKDELVAIDILESISNYLLFPTSEHLVEVICIFPLPVWNRVKKLVMKEGDTEINSRVLNIHHPKSAEHPIYVTNGIPELAFIRGTNSIATFIGMPVDEEFMQSVELSLTGYAKHLEISPKHLIHMVDFN